ncbi:MAG: LolA family protein [Flavobacteriales bacterium]
MHKLSYLLFFMVYVIYGQTNMTVAEATQLKKKVKQQAAITNTISSDFTQYKHLDFLTNDMVSSGKLVFQSPDIVKWQYLKPFEYVVLFKNETIFINDQGHKSQVDIGSSDLFKQLNQLIINSVKGDLFNDDEFEITYFKVAKNSQVHFKPKDKKFANYIQEFQITFNAKGEVIEVKMIEPTGDFSNIVFSNRIINKNLDASIFNH